MDKRMKFADLVGHRIIYCAPYITDAAVELFVIELSPSGKHVKVRYPIGLEQWKIIGTKNFQLSEEDIVEDLGLLKCTKRRKHDTKRFNAS
jgi:hypothetical protein